MTLEEKLLAVRNDHLEFATLQPADSRFATLERRVVITGQAELVELSHTGNIQVLEGLIAQLNHPDRAWASEVLLAAMTGHEGKIVDSFATKPDEWRDSLGKTAGERWTRWLNEKKGTLVWDSAQHVFVENQ